MTRRAGSVVATAAGALALAVVSALLAACGQKGALTLAKPTPSSASPALPASAAIVVPPTSPTSAPTPR